MAAEKFASLLLEIVALNEDYAAVIGKWRGIGPICGSFSVLNQPGETSRLSGGGGGIRTHETLTGLTVFKTVAIDHSAISLNI